MLNFGENHVCGPIELKSETLQLRPLTPADTGNNPIAAPPDGWTESPIIARPTTWGSMARHRVYKCTFAMLSGGFQIFPIVCITHVPRIYQLMQSYDKIVL